jgi:osomolarity two-component system sensor histidine kinase TcsA
MSNATKFTEQGYVRMDAHLQSENHDSYVILTEVIDSGIGVPTVSSGALFTPFTQFDNSATKKYQGTGLGLSICKSLAELMNGEIGFRANPDGQGSIFWFTTKMKKVKQLPSVDVIHEQIKDLALHTPIVPLEDIKIAAADKTILLAEDNPINQKVMLKMLAGLGFNNIDRAVNGRQAVAMSTKVPAPYSAILMDINMPLLDGVGATREIRDAGVDTPIIAMTANALKGQAESYIAKGMTAYVSKPVDRNILVKVLLNSLQPATHD